MTRRRISDPDRVVHGERALFVDRVTESSAFRAALAQHRTRMDQDLIETESLTNVLTFYGEGGVGKTELSKRLAAWLTGDVEAGSDWGRSPETAVDAIVRWDLNDSMGNLDPLPLLVALRRQLGSIEQTWPAFDLAFSAFHRSLNPGVEIDLRTPRSGGVTLSDVVAGLVGDAANATGLVVGGGVGALAAGAGRSLVARARAAAVSRRVLREYPTLEALIDECESMSGASEDTAKLAARLAFMVTRQIEAIEPGDRPLVVVFVDHMERLQRPGERHLGEGTLNGLISRLPYFLFVVTGRQSLRWHVARPELPASGADRWPLLSTEQIAVDEPRQHSIGNLAHADAADFLRASFDAEFLDVQPGLIEDLARSTDGWPLHLQTIVGVARERSRSVDVLTNADLGGPLPTLVERLLGDLPVEVADAFRAACLLPYFDTAFVAAAGELRAGAVEQLVQRQLVRPSESVAYPYRVHDTLRGIVRETGSAAVGGWGDDDWERHARIALHEAERRFDQSMEAGDDVAAVHSLALGLNVAAENKVFDEWLIRALRVSPNLSRLADYITVDPEAGAPADLIDVVAYLRCRSRALIEDVTDEMAAITRRRTAISSTAGVWRGYDLRRRGRVDEALEQWVQLLEEFGDRPALYLMQTAVTLRLGRRFQDCLSQLPLLTQIQADQQRASLQRVHGVFEGERELEERGRLSASRRFQIEVLGDTLLTRQRRIGVSADEVLDVHKVAVDVAHDSTQATCAGILAEIHLFDEQAYSERISELEELSSRRFEPYRSLVHALALRAWACNDDAAAARARHWAGSVTYRDSTWISTEVLFELLDMPLPDVVSQWLEPYEIVRARWIAVLTGIVDRARSVI